MFSRASKESRLKGPRCMVTWLGGPKRMPEQGWNTRRAVFLLVVWTALFTSSEAQTPAKGPAPAPAKGAAPAAKGPAPAPAKGAAPAAGNPVQANLGQLMRGILYPPSNVIFAPQTTNPPNVPPPKDPSTATDPLMSAYGK